MKFNLYTGIKDNLNFYNNRSVYIYLNIKYRSFKDTYLGCYSNYRFAL